MAKDKIHGLCLGLFFICIGLYCFGNSDSTRASVIKEAASQIGVREATNHNDGPQVCAYQQCANAPAFSEWCSSFVSWVFLQCHIVSKGTAWAPAWFTNRHTIYNRGRLVKHEPQPGDLGSFFNGIRICHVFFIEQWGHGRITTIHGNYGVPGGVYRVYLYPATIYQVADYIDIK